ncbi:hypothetical protein EHS13_16830 [Paenibacillus psychroresistens]|uniref:Uncharacterized protein n=1 Tax=Paenibacillus psychroresistens TaxID=1778678 RepID=A0A6B8RJJ5_9BACL|nr:hypothetical protein [Paenibacillus psychroresistens]QGQ96430.1 hypothetical protein EHS13_16830 [Paenibacillus psychroresistens]
MTINKKSSRKIVISDEHFVWTVSPGSGYIIMIAELESYNGRRLEVYIESDIDSLWVNFPNTEHLNLKILRPKDLEFFIKQSLEQDWNPKEKGAPLVFKFDGKQLTKRLN